MKPIKLSPIALATVVACSAPAAFAGAKIDITDSSYISVGAGMRSSVSAKEDAAPNGKDTSTDFSLDSIRLYVSGQVAPDFKFTFNTERLDDSVKVIDAVAQYEPSEKFNIWVGRMLTPADRIEMNGPYYALSWNQYTVPLFPSDQGGDAGRLGRDEGVTVWGTLGKFQYAVGAFEGLKGGANQTDSVLLATRLAYNFWNMEGNPAYYTSSTYYGGAGDVLTLGVSAQTQKDGAGSVANPADFTGYAVDLLMEKVFTGGSVLTVEGEFKAFDTDGNPTKVGDADCFCLFDGQSWFATAGYLIPQQVGPGKFQPYLRYTANDPKDADSSSLSEVGLNYVIKGHNLRFNLNYTYGDANLTGYAAAEKLSAVSFGLQYQI